MGKIDSTNATTKAQLAEDFDKAIERAKNPDPRDEIREIRKQKVKKQVKNYGF